MRKPVLTCQPIRATTSIQPGFDSIRAGHPQRYASYAHIATRRRSSAKHAVTDTVRFINEHVAQRRMTSLPDAFLSMPDAIDSYC